MVKYPLQKRPRVAEFRARLRLAKKKGLAGREAMACAMAEMNRKYNRVTARMAAGKPWKKPPGFDYEWWGGALVPTRLKVRLTKQEKMRKQERRAKFMKMVRESSKRMDAYRKSLKAGAQPANPANPRSEFDEDVQASLQAYLSNADFSSASQSFEDLEMQRMFIEASNAAAGSMDPNDDLWEPLKEPVFGNTNSSLWDLPDESPVEILSISTA